MGFPPEPPLPLPSSPSPSERLQGQSQTAINRDEQEPPPPLPIPPPAAAICRLEALCARADTDDEAARKSSGAIPGTGQWGRPCRLGWGVGAGLGGGSWAGKTKSQMLNAKTQRWNVCLY